jgi:hypothetical protein
MTIVDEDGEIPHVEGSELTVLDAYRQYVQGRDPAQIADDYRVKIARVHEALAYYYDNAERMIRLESDSLCSVDVEDEHRVRFVDYIEGEERPSDQLETATADRDDCSGTTPADAGEALFGDGPENDIADVPDLGRSPIPDREDGHESQ